MNAWVSAMANFWHLFWRHSSHPNLKGATLNSRPGQVCILSAADADLALGPDMIRLSAGNGGFRPLCAGGLRLMGQNPRRRVDTTVSRYRDSRRKAKP